LNSILRIVGTEYSAAAMTMIHLIADTVQTSGATA